MKGAALAQRVARAGAPQVARAVAGRRHGSSWSHGGVMQQAAARVKAESMDRAVAAFAKQHGVEIPKGMRDAKAFADQARGGGHGGAARGAAGFLAVGGMMGGLILWINEEVKNKPSQTYQAVNKVVRRVSGVSIGV